MSYLHTFVNDLLRASMGPYEDKLRKYFLAGKDASISLSYRNLIDWSAECLVHALSFRITFVRLTDPAIREVVESNMINLTKGGYTLLEPLYRLLADFERSGEPFDRYLPVLLRRLPEYRG
jgi:hypothetical protein